MSVADLRRAYATHGRDADFVPWCLSAIDHLDVEQVWRPWWLLRQHARSGGIISRENLGRIVGMADGLDHWAARLNFCQMMAAVPIPSELIDDVFGVLHPLTSDRLPVIRAWAISALYPFRNAEKIGPQIKTAIARLKREESKAIRARLRRLKNA